MDSQYSSALKNYGFSQGDIGKALAAFADARSFTTAVDGHIDETVVSELMSLLNVNIDQRNTLSRTLTTLSRILMLAIIGVNGGFQDRFHHAWRAYL